MCEKLWLEWVKAKWPTLTIGSEEYNARRKAYYAGMYTSLMVIMKTPPRAMDKLISNFACELRAELKRGNAEIVNLNHN